MIKRLIQTQLKKHIPILLVLFLIAAAVSALPYGFSFLGKWLVDEALQVTGPPKPKVVEGEAAPAPTIEWREKTKEEKLRLLGIFFGVSMGLHFVATGLSAISEFLNSRTTQQITYDLRQTVQEKVSSLEMGLFGREQVGQLMTRIMDDTAGIPGNLTNLVINFCTQVVMLGLGASLLFRLSAKLAPIALLALPFYAVICIFFLPKIRRNAEELRIRGAAFNGFVVERLTNVTTIKNYAQEDREVGQFSTILDNNMTLQRAQQKLNLGFSTLTTLVTSIGTLAVLTFGFLRIQAGQMQLGETLAFYQITAQLFVPISALVGMTTVGQTLQVLGKRVYDILDLPSTVVDPETAVELPEIRGDIAFENVSLRYQEGGPLAVEDVSFSIPAGQMVCIVGPTGAGKRTLLTLLTRLYDPTEGVIRIDGLDTRRIPLHRLRLAVGNIFRECQVFSGTVAENIAYGLPGATEAQIEEVARIVELHDFIIGLPDGYETRLGRGGVTINTEQLVKLSFARALLTNPAILAIDDTYSTLAGDVAQRLQQAVRQTLLNRTIIITTSLLSICEDADLVVVMRNGKVEELGTHEELLATPGVYRRMYMLQMGLEGLDEALSEQAA